MRKFFCVALAALTGCLPVFSACAHTSLLAKDEYNIFGSQVRWVYSSSEQPEALWAALSESARAIESSISVSAEDSAVSRFNRAAAGETVDVGETAYRILQTARNMYEETDGAYDPAVGLLVDLWGFSPRHRLATYTPTLPYDRADFEQELPEEKYCVAFSQPAVSDFGTAELSLTQTTLTKPSAVAAVEGDDTQYTMQLSLDGIGKGACVDAAAEILSAADVEYGYFNAGGSSLLVLENPDDESGLWEISVSSPREELDDPYATLLVRDTTVSTSGDYEQYYEIEGTRYCHIIGKAGKPVGAGSHVVCATVVGGLAAEGDARATALVTMSADEACAYASAHADDFRVMFVWFGSETEEYTLYTNLDAENYRVTAAFDHVEVFA